MNEKHNLDHCEPGLAERLQAGEPGAFRELVENLQDRVLNTCYRFVLNREDAEDIAQEVFVEVHRSITTFKGQSRLSTWVYRIAVTKSIDFIRKARSKKRSAPLKRLFGHEEQSDDIPAPATENPAENLEREERKKILLDAVSSLSKNQRVVFTLGKYKGFGNKEIAEILDCSLSSVESLMHRAKKNLEKALYGYFEKDLKNRRKFFLFFASYITGRIPTTALSVIDIVSITALIMSKV